MVRRKIAPLLIILLLAATATAQDGYKGKEFWLVFPQNARSGENQSALQQYVLITGNDGGKGTATHTATGKKHDFKIGASGTARISFDTVYITSEGKHSDTWHITSSDKISVMAMSHRKASTDSYMVIPMDRLGERYAVIGYYPLHSGDIFTTQFDVIATEDQTSVRFEYPLSINREAMTITLNRGEATHYNSKNVSGRPGDFTGTIVTSDKPIAFFTGHTCAQVPADDNFCDFLIEMLPPDGDLGVDHIVPKLIDQERSSIRVIAVSDYTEVMINGERRSMLRRGEYYHSDSITGSARVMTSKPAYVVQFGQSADVSEDKVADPFMMVIAPMHKGVSRLEIAVPQFTIDRGHYIKDWEHFINVVTTREGVDRITSEPPILFQKFFKQVGNSDFYVAALPITHTHYDLRSESPFIVYQYGYNSTYDSYGHLCGMK